MLSRPKANRQNRNWEREQLQIVKYHNNIKELKKGNTVRE